MEKAIINERNKDINIGDMIWRKEAAYQFDDVVEYGYVTMNVYSEIGMNLGIQGVEAMFFGREEHGRAYLDYYFRGTTWDKIR